MKVIYLVLTIFVFALNSKVSFASNILLNEIMANVSSGENEWIEFYNTSSSEVDISGWSIEERTGPDLTGIKSHPIASLSIPGNGFKIFEFTTASLNNSGDIITLKDNSGNVKDSYQYSSSTQNKTFGRQPDGGNWNSGLDPTKNSSNGGFSSTPSPSPTQTSSPTATSNTSSFIISNITSQINSDQSFTTTVNLSSPDDPNTKFYLKGAFKKDGESNYFGLTKVSGSFVKNGSSFSEQYPITTDSSGNWSGELETKVDNDDSGFSGTGNYIFKVGKYNSNNANPSVSWSNEVTVKIISTEINQATNLNTSPSPSPINPSPLVSPKSKLISSKKGPDNKPDYRTASVAAAATTASSSASASVNPVKVEVKNQKQLNPLIWIGLILIIAAGGLIGYIYFGKNAKIHH